jgi:hypothetical protein
MTLARMGAGVSRHLGKASLAAWTARPNSSGVVWGSLLSTSCVACVLGRKYISYLYLLTELQAVSVSYRVHNVNPRACFAFLQLPVNQKLHLRLLQFSCKSISTA